MRGLAVMLAVLAALTSGCFAPSPGCAYPLQRLDSFGTVTWNETGAYDRLVNSPHNHWVGHFGHHGLPFDVEPYASQWGGEWLRLMRVVWNLSDEGHSGGLVLSVSGEVSASIEPAPPTEELERLFYAFATNATSGDDAQLGEWFDEFADRKEVPDNSWHYRPPHHSVQVGRNETVERWFRELSSQQEPIIEKSMGHRSVQFGAVSFEFLILVASLSNPDDQWGHLAMDPEIAEYSFGRSWGDAVDDHEVRAGLREAFAAYDLGETELGDEPVTYWKKCVKAWQ